MTERFPAVAFWPFAGERFEYLPSLCDDRFRAGARIATTGANGRSTCGVPQEGGNVRLAKRIEQLGDVLDRRPLIFPAAGSLVVLKQAEVAGERLGCWPVATLADNKPTVATPAMKLTPAVPLRRSQHCSETRPWPSRIGDRDLPADVVLPCSCAG